MKNFLNPGRSSLRRRKFLQQVFGGVGLAAAGFASTRSLGAEPQSEQPYASTVPQTQGKPPQFKTKLKITEGSFDTGYACRLDRETKMLIIDGPPGGIVSVGGYRFSLRAAQDLVAGIEDERRWARERLDAL